MPRYLVQRTFPDGLSIPATPDGAKACLGVVEGNAGLGVTWVHSYVSTDHSVTYCVYDGPSPEAVLPEEPAEPPMDGATYGSFPAACHYEDGLFVQAAAEDECAATHPESGAAFTFWHPDLVTFHVWTRMHNPDGL